MNGRDYYFEVFRQRNFANTMGLMIKLNEWNTKELNFIIF